MYIGIRKTNVHNSQIYSVRRFNRKDANMLKYFYQPTLFESNLEASMRNYFHGVSGKQHLPTILETTVSHFKSCISTLIKPLRRGVLLLKYYVVLLEQYH